MPKTSKIIPHLSLLQLDEPIKQTDASWKIQPWLVIRHAMVKPAWAKDIGQAVGLSTSTLQKLIGRYNKMGQAAINTKGKGGRMGSWA